jgi:AraC-like DNA-binding protein
LSRPRRRRRGAPPGNTRARARARGGKLDAPTVRRILALLEEGARVDVIAHRFELSERHVQRIRSGESWGHLREAS